MKLKPILCVDFDGVINSYTSGWKRADIIEDPPVPGAIQWLWKASEYFDVQIYSSRTRQSFGVYAMQKWLGEFALQEFGDVDLVDKFMKEISFPVQKPAAFLTIDDRAICFEGDWSKFDPVAMLNFKPWNKRS